MEITGSTRPRTCGNASALHRRQATEAVEDEEAVWMDPDPKSRSGHSVRVIGYSLSAGTVLTVILLKLDEGWVGANGWKSNSTDQRIYKEA